MMKTYQLYVFSQDHCPPCQRLKDHIRTLPTSWQGELKTVPLRTSSGSLTALAEELDVVATPTLVVVHEGVQCDVDRDGDEDCSYTEEPVERFEGANAIIEHLDATIRGYTYAEPDD